MTGPPVAPENLQKLMPKHSVSPDPLSLNTYGLQADRLRRDRRIAQVICMVK
jgi:hypothetical protein